MSDDPGGAGDLARLQELARLVSESGLQAILATLRKHGGLDEDMLKILAEVARTGLQERDQRAAAKAVLDAIRDRIKLGADVGRFVLDIEKAKGPDADVHPDQRHVHMVIPPDPVHCKAGDCTWRGHRREAPDGVCPRDGSELVDG